MAGISRIVTNLGHAMKKLAVAVFTVLIFLIVSALTPGAAQPAGTWPKVENVNGFKLTWYEPQATGWKDYKVLTGMMAISILEPGKTAPIYGVVHLSANTVADPQGGTVVVSNIQVTSTSFPTLSADQQQKADAYIRSRSGELGSRVVPLNTITLSLQKSQNDSSKNDSARSAKVNTTPPQILYSNTPAILVLFDGDPLFGPIKGVNGDLTFAVNTNWNVLKTANTYFLLNQTYWLQASSVNGPWKAAGKLPAIFSQLPNDDNWKQVRASLGAAPIAASKVPKVWVSTGQAEAIVTDGAPKKVAIANTALSYIDNTDATLFYDSTNKKYYYLTSGRWFATANLSNGPWIFAGNLLPADFAKIPANSPRGWVLANVPGTPQAAAAVSAASVPQTASVNRSQATLTVTYAGDPQFKTIPGTDLQYAVNTSFDVLKVGDSYYACENGVWFTASSPNGPWTVADKVPDSIYAIPSNQPLYNDTYVNVDSSDTTTVTYSYTSGYNYMYPWYGGLYYGMGYWYAPWFGYYGGFPYYYPWPRTYVGGAYYNSATGAYARGYGVYGPYGGARVGGGYNPTTGNYWRGGAVYGPYGGAGRGTIYNPATGNYWHGAAAWGPNGIVTRGSSGNISSVNSVGNRYGAGTTSNAYKNWGNAATLRSAQTPTQFKPGYGGNVYAGNDGNVYRPSTTGGWQQYNNASGQWNNKTGEGWGSQNRGYTNNAAQTGWNNAATRGSANTTASQLNRDSFARSAGPSFGGGGFRGGGFRGR